LNLKCCWWQLLVVSCELCDERACSTWLWRAWPCTLSYRRRGVASRIGMTIDTHWLTWPSARDSDRVAWSQLLLTTLATFGHSWPWPTTLPAGVSASSSRRRPRLSRVNHSACCVPRATACHSPFSADPKAPVRLLMVSYRARARALVAASQRCTSERASWS
jgi:hypothetical protein